MIRATTPKHSLIFSVDPEEAFAEILITFAQDGKVILEKRMADLEFTTETSDEHTLYIASYTLSQDETKNFNPRSYYVQLQVRCLDQEGHALATEVKRLSVYNVLNDEVLK